MTYSADLYRLNGPRRKTRWVPVPAPTTPLRPVIGQPHKHRCLKTGRTYKQTGNRWYRLEAKP